MSRPPTSPHLPMLHCSAVVLDLADLHTASLRFAEVLTAVVPVIGQGLEEELLTSSCNPTQLALQVGRDHEAMLPGGMGLFAVVHTRLLQAGRVPRQSLLGPTVQFGLQKVRPLSLGFRGTLAGEVTECRQPVRGNRRLHNNVLQFVLLG
jgi:hypothetical protein